MVERGYRVTIIDDLSTGNVSNVKSLLDNGKADLIKGSVTDFTLLKRQFEGSQYIFHLAALSSVPKSIDDPGSAHEINATGTLNVLIAARDCGVKKVIFASSAAVYGDAPGVVKSEDMIPAPLSPYAVSKLAAEYYCGIFEKIYGIATVSLRYFNVYGPRQDPDSPYAAVIPLFMRMVMDGKAPVVFGDGEQSRDFIFVKDAVEANINAADSDATGVFNLGNSKKVTINELARLVIEISGNTALKPVYREPRPGDIRHSFADIQKAGAFGFKPEYSLSEGLRETWDALRP